jgi:hypothetical protein
MNGAVPLLDSQSSSTGAAEPAAQAGAASQTPPAVTVKSLLEQLEMLLWNCPREERAKEIALAAEDEKLTAERVGADHLLDLRRKAVKAVAKVDRLTGEEHLRAGREADHTISFTLASTRMRAPLGRSISIAPVRSS